MTMTINEFDPAIAVNDLQRQLDNILAVAVAGRLMLEAEGEDADATVLGLFATIEELATPASAIHHLRDYLARQTDQAAA